METEQIQKENQKENDIVTKDMIIGDVLKKHPDVAVIMLEHGLHCVGCHANVYDTIEAGCKIHGIDDETIEKLVKQINEFIAAEKKKVAPEGPVKITMTEAAANKVLELLKKEKQEGYGLRISVMPGGCSGFMYQMNFEEKPAEGDTVIESQGVKMFIDADGVDMLRDAEVDYVESLNESGFKINNPNAEKSCGCGKSFS